jgi:hypothetical protein
MSKSLLVSHHFPPKRGIHVFFLFILLLFALRSPLHALSPPPVSPAAYTPVPSSLLVAVRYGPDVNLYRVDWTIGASSPVGVQSNVPVPDFWRVYIPPGTVHVGLLGYSPSHGTQAGLYARYGQNPGPLAIPSWDAVPWQPAATPDLLKIRGWPVRVQGCTATLLCVDRWIYPPVELGGWIFGATIGDLGALRVQLLVDKPTFDEWQSRTSFDYMGNPPLATETEDPEIKVMLHLYPDQDPELRKGVINLHRPGVKRVYTIPADTSRAVFRIER